MGARMAYADRQIAFGVNVDDVASMHGLFWLESVEDGWWYAMPRPSGGAHIVFVTQERPSGMSDSSRRRFFADAFSRTMLLREAFPGELSFDAVSVFDARLSRPIDNVPDTVVRIGDAIGSSDPLSGRGCAGATRSAQAAAIAVDEFLRTDSRDQLHAFTRESVADFERQRIERAFHWARGGILEAARARPNACPSHV
jgi:flavin-dependent dehydrogenase